MTITANAGPYIAFGQVASADGRVTDYNPDVGPSFFNQGAGIMDPRAPFNYDTGGSSPVYGWLGTTLIPVMDFVPAAIAAAGIAAAATVTALTPMTLVSSTGNGVTVGASVTNAATGNLVTGLLAIGGAGGSVAFGQSGRINIWDPTKSIARAVAVTASATATGVHFIVNGYDIYGYPMSENINAAGNATTSGKKAFKYIASVIPQTTDSTAGHTYSIGTTDIYGFPLLAQSWAYVQAFLGNPATPANNQITAATGFVPPVTTAATQTSGDVRGTYALQTAADGTIRLTVFVTPSVANIGSTAGLVGVTQA